MEGMALAQANQGQPRATQEAMVAKARHRIAGARRLEPAHWTEQRRECDLVEANQRQQHFNDHVAPSPFASRNPATRRCSSFSTLRHSFITSGVVSPSSGLRTITTMSTPSGTSPGSWRKVSRTNRFARLRTTAHPTLRVTVIPSRVGAKGMRGAMRNTKCFDVTRTPRD